MARTYTRHGMTNTRTYRIWKQMKQRCCNEDNPGFRNYGGRGITVVDRWLDFVNFHEDMGDAPDDLSLERVNNDSDYCKSNCKWATRSEQNNNRRTNTLLTHEGETLNVIQWSRKLGIKSTTIHERIRKGWSTADCLQPVLVRR